MLFRDLPAIVVATILLTLTAVILLFAVGGSWRRNWQLAIAAAAWRRTAQLPRRQSRTRSCATVNNGAQGRGAKAMT